MSKLILKRRPAWGDKFRAYRIVFDGIEVGSIKESETWSHDCVLGTHTLELKIDWCRSPKATFEMVSENSVLEFECKNNVKPLLTIFYLFKPTSWIALVRRSW